MQRYTAHWAILHTDDVHCTLHTDDIYCTLMMYTAHWGTLHTEAHCTLRHTAHWATLHTEVRCTLRCTAHWSVTHVLYINCLWCLSDQYFDEIFVLCFWDKAVWPWLPGTPCLEQVGLTLTQLPGLCLLSVWLKVHVPTVHCGSYFWTEHFLRLGTMVEFLLLF